jgi:hypothetical protein
MMSSLAYFPLRFVLDLDSQEYTSAAKLRSNPGNEIAVAGLWSRERICPCRESRWTVDAQREKRQRVPKHRGSAKFLCV